MFGEHRVDQQASAEILPGLEIHGLLLSQGMRDQLGALASALAAQIVRTSGPSHVSRQILEPGRDGFRSGRAPGC